MLSYLTEDEHKLKDCSVYEDCLDGIRTEIVEYHNTNKLQIAAVGCWGVYCNQGIYIKEKKKERTPIVRNQLGVLNLLRSEFNKWARTEFPITDMFLAGDNVYELLPRLGEDKKINFGEYDIEKQLERGFRDCFAQSGIQNFYIGIGNHDIENCDILNAQINYRHPKWKMPSLYYNVVYEMKDYKVNVIVMDTNMFDDKPKQCNGNSFTLEQINTQKEWIREQIRKVKAKWNVIVGHIPYYATGHKEKTKIIDRPELRDFIHGIKPHVYVCADEHNQQVIKDGDTVIVVSGSGGTHLDDIMTPLAKGTLSASRTFGFAEIRFTTDNIEINTPSVNTL